MRTTQKKSQKRFETIQNDVHEKLIHLQKCQTESNRAKKKKKNQTKKKKK